MPAAPGDDWVEPYDLFVSYARADNGPPHQMVSALVEAVEADFARFAPDTPLRVFFDKRSIRDGQFWQDEIRKGLRQSKVMLAVLSEAYFASEWCRREWEEYVLVEKARTYPGEALTPVFIVAPADLARLVPPSARAWWDDLTARNAVVEIQPFWPAGRAALQEQVVADRVRRLAENVRRRADHGRVLAKVPRNLRGRNPAFVGRRAELAKLRDALSRYEVAGVCAVNGVGGVGKSATAREYAHLFRREYLGGQFELDLGGVSAADRVWGKLADLARDYLGADIPRTLPEDAQHARAVAAFDRLPPGHTALLILDNLEEDATALVGRGRAALFPSAEKVHLLVTTRADPRALGGMDCVSLDVLPPADALDLLLRYRAFAHDPADPDWLAARDGRVPEAGEPAGAEWKAALAIAHRLGRHTLAVALVGAYLGSYPDVTYARFAAEMGEHGIGLALDAVGSDEKVRNLVHHPETLVGPLFERSIARLTPLAVRVLEYAAFLPPDTVPVAWLKALAEADPGLAAALKPQPFRPPPWDETLRALAGLQYLVGGPYATMHRVVQEVVRRRMPDGERAARQDAVLAFVEARVIANWNDTTRFADLKEMRTAEELVRVQTTGQTMRGGKALRSLVLTLIRLGRLRSARDMARVAERITSEVAHDGLPPAETRGELSACLGNLGDASRKAGYLEAARHYFESCLRSACQEVGDVQSVEAKMAWLLITIKLADVCRAGGDLGRAAELSSQAMQFGTEARNSNISSPDHHRELLHLFLRLGDISLESRDFDAALRNVGNALKIAHFLVHSGSYSITSRPDLLECYRRLAILNHQAGKQEAAKFYYSLARQMGYRSDFEDDK